MDQAGTPGPHPGSPAKEDVVQPSMETVAKSNVAPGFCRWREDKWVMGIRQFARLAATEKQFREQAVQMMIAEGVQFSTIEQVDAAVAIWQGSCELERRTLARGFQILSLRITGPYAAHAGGFEHTLH